MAEAAKDQDQSMEDILQSIKRIIAEEGEPAPSSGSDVLELTELLAEDGSISKTPPSERNPMIETMSIDEIMAAPVSSMPAEEKPPAPVQPAPAAAVALEPEPAPVRMPEPQAAPAPAALEAVDEELISGAALSASVSALNALRDSMAAPSPVSRPDSSPTFRSGVTVEDLVRESLRPMLKDWIDQNLPGIVEALVKKEIAKLSQS